MSDMGNRRAECAARLGYSELHEGVQVTNIPSSGLWLTPAELYELTGYKQRAAQTLALGLMNIPFRLRQADGYPLVDRWRFEGEIIIRPTAKRPRRAARKTDK
jgi:hypothetical protein